MAVLVLRARSPLGEALATDAWRRSARRRGEQLAERSSAAAGSASQCSVMLVAMRSKWPSAVGRAASMISKLTRRGARRKIAPALLDHGRCEVGEEESPSG